MGKVLDTNFLGTSVWFLSGMWPFCVLGTQSEKWKPLTKVRSFIHLITSCLGSRPYWLKSNYFWLDADLRFFGLLNPCSYFLWPLNTLEIPLGTGWSGGPLGKGCRFSTHLRKGQDSLKSANNRLGCGLGKKWPLFTDCIWYILCDTWRDKRDVPALNWNLSFLSLIFSLPPVLPSTFLLALWWSSGHFCQQDKCLFWL